MAGINAAAAGLPRRHPRREVLRRRGRRAREVPRGTNEAFRRHEGDRSYRFMGAFHAAELAVHGAAVHRRPSWAAATSWPQERPRRDRSGHLRPVRRHLHVAPVEQLINFTETLQKGYAGFRRFIEVLAERPDVATKPGALHLWPPRRLRRRRCAALWIMRDRDVLSLRRHPSRCCDGLHAGHPRRHHGGARGALGRRQDHHLLASAALLRPWPAARWTIDGVDVRDVTVASAARRHRHRAAGRVPVRRHRAREHRLRPPRRHPGRDRGGGAQAPTSTSSSARCPTATTRSWASAGRGCPAARSSASPSRACSCATRASSFWTRPRAPLTTRASAPSRRRSRSSPAGAPRIAIAHRLSTIRGADLIAVVEDGRVARAGHPRGAAGPRRHLRPLLRHAVRRLEREPRFA